MLSFLLPSPARITFFSMSVCVLLILRDGLPTSSPSGTGPRPTVKPKETIVLRVKLSRGDSNKHIGCAFVLLHSHSFSHDTVWNNTEPKRVRDL